MSALPGCMAICTCIEGKRKWFVIGDNMEGTSSEKVSEVLDSEENG